MFKKKMRWLKVKEVAKMLGITPQRVYILVRNGRFRTKDTKFRRLILIHSEDVEQYLDEKNMMGV